jgi:glycosyltransferase involved in cell wall biosynthesis
VLKALSLLPWRRLQTLAVTCNPICWGMWRDAGRARECFDLVHAAAFPYTWPIACGLRLAHRLRVPFLLTPFLHLGDPENPKDRTRRAYTSRVLLPLLQAADVIFAQTQLERQALLDLKLPAERIVLQGLGVDPAECTGGDRSRARHRWGVAEGDVVVGHLANQSEEKGTVDLVRAAEPLWQKSRRFHLVLAGPEMPSFQHFWEKYPAGPGRPIHRLGVLSDEERRDFFAGIDVFALPSRSDSFGLVLLEAWANGLPNLAYRAGGIAEVVQHGRDGLLVRCGDVDELATALARLIDDEALRHELGTAGRDRTQHEFRWQEKLELVRSVYEQMASTHFPVATDAAR